MHVVADLADVRKPYEMSICSLGIMGTQYEFDEPLPPDSIEATSQKTKSL